MADRRAFRPSLSESLEERLVPSLAAAPTPPAVSRPSLPSPPPLQLGAVLGDAFRGFIGGYAEAVKTVLCAAGDSGPVDPGANRLAFNACVGAGLTILTATLVKSLSKDLDESSVNTSVRDPVLGDGPDSLESRLLALPTEAIIPSGEDESVAADPLRVVRQSYIRVARRILARQGMNRLRRTFAVYPQLVGSSDSAESALSSVVDQVRAAFAAFLKEYFQAVQEVLLRADPGPEGRIDASARRSEFDAAVSAALQSLETHIGVALNSVGSNPAFSTLTPGAREMIVGNGPDSLSSQLALVPTPSWSSPAMTRDFTLDTFRIVASVLALITGDLPHFSSREDSRYPWSCQHRRSGKPAMGAR